MVPTFSVDTIHVPGAWPRASTQCTVEPATVPARARLTSIGNTSARAASGHAMPKALLPVLPHIPSCAAQVPPFQGNLPRHPYPSPSTHTLSPLAGLHVPTGTLSSTKLSATAQGGSAAVSTHCHPSLCWLCDPRELTSILLLVPSSLQGAEGSHQAGMWEGAMEPRQE